MVVLRFPQFSVNIQVQRELEYYDEIRQSVGDDEEKRRDSVRPDTEAPRKPLADNAPEKERKRQHAYDRDVLQDT